MIINANKTEIENLINQINEDELSDFKLGDLDFSRPAPIVGADLVTLDDLRAIAPNYDRLDADDYIEDDTFVMISPGALSIYGGSSKRYNYRRINLSVQWAIINGTDFVLNRLAPLDDAMFEERVYNILKHHVNYIKDSFTYTRNELPTGDVEVILTPKKDSYCYNYGLTVLFRTHDLKKDPDYILDGLSWSTRASLAELKQALTS